MRLRIRAVAFATLSLLLVVSLLLGACAKAPAPAAEKSVKVAQIAFTTGPVADGGLPAAQGGADWFNWMNEQGGIDGIKIDYKWIDTGYEAPRAIAAYQRLKEWGTNVIWSIGTVPNDAIRELAKEDGMPIVTWGGAAAQYYPVKGNVFFGTGKPHTVEGRAALVWMIKNLKDLPQKPKVALIHPDDAYGWSFANGPLYYGDVDGYEIVANQLLSHGALDATTQIRHAIDAKADIIWLTYTAGTGAVVMRDARRLGFKGPLAVAHTSTVDYAIGKLSEGGAEGAYFNTFSYLLADKKPGMEKVFDMIKAYHPGVDPTRPVGGIITWQHGVTAAAVIGEAIRAAVNKVGYDKLNRKAMWDGLESLKNVDIYGIQKVSFSTEEHGGASGYGMYQYEKGNFKLVGDLAQPPPVADWEREGKFKWAK